MEEEEEGERMEGRGRCMEVIEGNSNFGELHSLTQRSCSA